MISNRKPESVCLHCCSIIVILTSILTFIIGFVEIGNLNTINSRIDAMSYSYVSCYDACGNQYIQSGSLCCLYYNYYNCYSLSYCIQRKLSSLRDQHDGTVLTIWICSIITVVLWVFFCCLRKCGSKSSNSANNAQNPLLDSLNGNINRSQQGNKKSSRIDAHYQSFAYQDNQSTCCICLEEFNNEKAILLKCGHIFHSLCIRDWAAKQENCPVCRSSQ